LFKLNSNKVTNKYIAFRLFEERNEEQLSIWSKLNSLLHSMYDEEMEAAVHAIHQLLLDDQSSSTSAAASSSLLFQTSPVTFDVTNVRKKLLDIKLISSLVDILKSDVRFEIKVQVLDIWLCLNCVTPNVSASLATKTKLSDTSRFNIARTVQRTEEDTLMIQMIKTEACASGFIEVIVDLIRTSTTPPRTSGPLKPARSPSPVPRSDLTESIVLLSAAALADFCVEEMYAKRAYDHGVLLTLCVVLRGVRVLEVDCLVAIVSALGSIVADQPLRQSALGSSPGVWTSLVKLYTIHTNIRLHYALTITIVKACKVFSHFISIGV